jgi:hypothetical protein
MITTGIFIFHPTISGYPKAKFPGVVVFSEIYQGEHVCRGRRYHERHSSISPPHISSFVKTAFLHFPKQ